MHGHVVATERITPAMVRVTLAGEGLSEFGSTDHTDAYINVAIPPIDATYDPPFDIEELRSQVPKDHRPVRRRYTVRRWDPVDRVLTVDVVVHAGKGVGGPWADAAEPGDALVFSGPTGSYRPDPAVDWHLLVGDEAALPAIAASLEAAPAGAPVVVRLVCDGPDHMLELGTPGELDIAWLCRTGDRGDADLLPAAVRDLTFLPGRVHAFVHGEAGEVREIRRHLLADRALPRADLSASPYWRRHLTDEAWREIKPAWNASVEHDVT
ncbi:siderophore-interacting protein [soil metagenome]